MSNQLNPLSVYVHIPFCRKRCGYCDFNTYAGMEYLIDAYVDSIIKELRYFSTIYSSDHLVHTIYFGGGTPTILPEDAYRRILSEIKNKFYVTDEVEISSEANPTNLTIDYLSGLHDAGINRLSMGMQSAVANELKILDRSQKLEDVQKSVKNARKAGIKNINLDLIFGIPTQTMDTFEVSIYEAIALTPQHLSIYGLTLGETVPLTQKIQKGNIPEIDEDLAGGMYEWVIGKLPSFNYTQYEISNWARNDGKVDYRCSHNLQYWRNRDYLGLGAGAHSYIRENRWNTVYPIPEYISGIEKSPFNSEFGHQAVAEWNHLSKNDIIKETMMMGLRLTEEGVNLDQFKQRFSIDINKIYGLQIKKLISYELLEYIVFHDSDVLRLTKKGRLVGNQVFLEFV